MSVLELRERVGHFWEPKYCANVPVLAQVLFKLCSMCQSLTDDLERECLFRKLSRLLLNTKVLVWCFQRIDTLAEYIKSAHDRKLRCQWDVFLHLTYIINTDVSKHSISRMRRKDFYQNVFLLSQNMKITFPVVSHRSCHACRSSYSFYIVGGKKASFLLLTVFVECVIWIFIRAHASANDSEFDQEIVYLKSSQSQILSRLLSWSLWNLVC